MKTGPVEKLFGCPSCGYQCNADFNASINLHRVFCGAFPVTKSMGNGKVSLNGEIIDRGTVKAAWEEVYRRRLTEQQTPF